MKHFKNKMCEMCGISYTPTTGGQKFCFKCIPIRAKEHIKTFNEKLGKEEKKARSRRYYLRYKHTQAHKRTIHRAVAKYISIPENVRKNRARQLLRDSVKKGETKKLPCEICGVLKVEGHHDDYSKPLQVKWLCRYHHVDLHWYSTSS